MAFTPSSIVLVAIWNCKWGGGEGKPHSAVLQQSLTVGTIRFYQKGMMKANRKLSSAQLMKLNSLTRMGKLHRFKSCLLACYLSASFILLRAHNSQQGLPFTYSQHATHLEPKDLTLSRCHPCSLYPVPPGIVNTAQRIVSALWRSKELPGFNFFYGSWLTR